MKNLFVLLVVLLGVMCFANQSFALDWEWRTFYNDVEIKVPVGATTHAETTRPNGTKLTVLRLNSAGISIVVVVFPKSTLAALPPAPQNPVGYPQLSEETLKFKGMKQYMRNPLKTWLNLHKTWPNYARETSSGQPGGKWQWLIQVKPNEAIPRPRRVIFARIGETQKAGYTICLDVRNPIYSDGPVYYDWFTNIKVEESPLLPGEYSGVQATQIENFKTEPEVAGLGDEITVTAQLSNPDTDIGKIYLILDEDNKNPIYEENVSSKTFQLSHTFQSSEKKKHLLGLVLGDSSDIPKEEVIFTVLGIEKPQILLESVPDECNIRENCDVRIKINNFAEVGRNLSYTIDWGDASTEERRLKKLGENGSFTLSHAYADAGECTISVTVTAKSKKNSLTSTAVTADVNIKFVVPQVQLTRDTSRRYENNQLFHIKTSQGSYPITWTLDFGGGQVLSGQGSVDRDVSHFYPGAARGGIQVVFEVVDSKNNEYTKNVHFRIQNDAVAPPPSDVGQPSSGAGQPPQSISEDIQPRPRLSPKPAKPEPRQAERAKPPVEQDTKKPSAIDLSIKKIYVSSKLTVGKKVSITVTLQNHGPEGIDKCTISLSTSDGLKEDQVVSLKKKGSKKVKFSWTPKKAGSQTLLASVECVGDTDSSNNTMRKKIMVGKE